MLVRFVYESEIKNFNPVLKDDIFYIVNSEYMNLQESQILVIMDKVEELGIKEIGRKLINFLKNKKVKKATVDLKSFTNMFSSGLVVRMFITSLFLNKLDAKDYDVKNPNFLDLEPKLDFITDNYPKLTKDIFNNIILKPALDISSAIWNAKRLGNYPHNLLKLNKLVSIISERYTNWYNDKNIKILKFMDESELLEKNYELIPAINRCSGGKARLLHIKYKPDIENKELPHFVLVGKGINFDSGGINLKPAESMTTMKYDKMGALTVLAAFEIIKSLKLNVELDVVVGFAENLACEVSFKPGDVIKAKNGKTIEIIHSDAEGRLMLADCLQYVDNEIKNYDYLLTAATLTGAAKRALGPYTGAIHSLKYKTSEDFIFDSKLVEEQFNYMFPHPKLKEEIKSKIANVRNVAKTDLAGSITAFWFLTEFTEQPDKLIHLDLAGPAWTNNGYQYANYGVTGFGIESIINFICNKLILREVEERDSKN